ncbi:hypothetical protein L218DRAFT_874780, partial [Marasmius fiardii PR-910]
VKVFDATLLVYDILLNLGLEIELIWTREWSWLTVLYIIQHYLPFFDTVGWSLHHHFGQNLSTRPLSLGLQHRVVYVYHTSPVYAGSDAIGIVLSEILLTVRVWAVWKRSTLVGIGLILFFLACWESFLALLGTFLSAMEFATLPLPNFRGCFISGGTHIIFLNWVLMMAYDTGELFVRCHPEL